ncbi:LLM class flavin-dependent oxidoreductase [soil metagenome]
MELGLFDILQIDPFDPRDHGQVYDQKLRDLERADQRGFRYYFTAERHFMPQFRCAAATPWISAIAQRTRSMRLGVMAYTLPIQDPVRLAEDIAMLDWLTDGRLEVGIGLGHRTEELVTLGVDPAQRIPIFQERAAVLQALWTGGSVSIESEHTLIRSAAISPVTKQQPNPPLWFAGSDPQAATWAGSIGLSLALGFKPATELEPAADAFHNAVKYRVNAKPERMLPGEGRLALMRQVYVAPTDQQALDEMSDDVYRLHQMSDQNSSASSDRDEARKSVESMIDDEIFIAGSPQTVASAILALGVTLGVDVFLANIYASGIDQPRIDRMLDLLSSEVAPLLDPTNASLAAV